MSPGRIAALLLISFATAAVAAPWEDAPVGGEPWIDPWAFPAPRPRDRPAPRPHVAPPPSPRTSALRVPPWVAPPCGSPEAEGRACSIAAGSPRASPIVPWLPSPSRRAPSLVEPPNELRGAGIALLSFGAVLGAVMEVLLLVDLGVWIGDGLKAEAVAAGNLLCAIGNLDGPPFAPCDAKPPPPTDRTPYERAAIGTGLLAAVLLASGIPLAAHKRSHPRRLSFSAAAQPGRATITLSIPF